MRRFQFRLESLLRLRIDKEEAAEQALARAMGEWNRIQGQKSRQQALKEKYKSFQASSGEELLQKGLFLARLDQEIRTFDLELERREPELSSLRAAYTEARSQREGLQKLKENREAEHRDKAEKFEARLMDDFINNMDRIKAFRER